MKKIILTFCILLATTMTACSSVPTENVVSTNEQAVPQFDEFERLTNRFSVEYSGLLASHMWSLTHTARSKEELDEVMALFQSFLRVLGSKDPVKLKEAGGARAFTDKFAKFLGSKDDTIAGFAAIVLGIAGDTGYAPQIAKLLDVDPKDKSFTDEYAYPPVTNRGRAAAALGIMGAKEFIPKILPLLKSKNQYDRSGAISALGYLGAKEYAKDVVAILTNKELRTADDPSPIYFLTQNNIAKDYKKELSEVMLDEFRSDTAETAAYALATIDAKEASADIAKLLDRRFRKGDAAKVLALLNATEYLDKIGSLLNDQESLVRKDAALSIGILKSKKHASKIAELLTAEEDFVRYYAAVSIILVEASEYYSRAIPVIEKTHNEGAYLNDGDFHPLVAERAKLIKEEFRLLLDKAKSSSQSPE